MVSMLEMTSLSWLHSLMDRASVGVSMGADKSFVYGLCEVDARLICS